MFKPVGPAYIESVETMFLTQESNRQYIIQNDLLNFDSRVTDYTIKLKNNERRTFEKQLNEAHKEECKINKDGIQVNTNGVGLNLIYTAVLCRS